MLVNFGNNKLASRLSEDSTNTSNLTAHIFYTLTFAPTLAPVLVFVTFFTNNKLFKQFMQAYLENYRAFFALIKSEDIAEKPLKA